MKKLDVVKVKLVKEKEALFQLPNNTIKSPSDAATIFEDFIDGADREHFVIGMLDAKNKLNALHTVSIGSLNSAIVHPREVFKIAILKNSASIILCHNHPSGDPRPSREDIKITERLIEAGKILGIEVLDHLIIGDDGDCLSLKEENLI